MSTKKKSLKAAEQDRPEVQSQRQAWRQQTIEVDPTRLVFLDESGARTNMTRSYGRCFGGQRLVDCTPHVHWRTTTMLSSMRLDGTTAAMVVDGATDRAVFQAYVDDVLAPSLRPGDIVVMDNLAPHKTPQVQAAIEARGASVRYLPPYSPDLNPIEKMWSKVKSLLRKIKARTFDTLVDAIAQALEAVTASDAKGWFKSCGYRQT